MKKAPAYLLLMVAGALTLPGRCQVSTAEFISFESAKPVLRVMGESLPSELKQAGSQLDAKAWAEWVKKEDAVIRQRLETGEEDTLTNLLRFGVTFTKEYQIDREYLGKYGHSTLVNSFGEHRADDLIRALRSPSAGERMQQMRVLLENKGFSFDTAAERDRLKEYLLANLARMRDEFNAYREKQKSAGIEERSQLYADRGISLDTNLWPDFALDLQFRQMLKTGLLKPGSVRRIAVVGPGLDFANKEYGNDFYPLQTTQPFAVMDSLARLGLADPASLELVTLDISPNVNVHLQRVRKAAAKGKAYTVQLAWNSAVPRGQDYLADFVKYWQTLGDQIGAVTKPVPVPPAVAGETHIRAVAIRPQVVTHITPINMNVVYQRLRVPEPELQFDLIIGTNVFIYYGAFEQSLARANLASMIKPGGFLLTNELLADKVPSQLVDAQRLSRTVSTVPLITDYMFCYKRDPSK
ncbi:MAG: hypothetical protein LAN63_14335 [Acidobacteriia bacterium]|nr:hypothetical protein [Terriglobia bacterium]